MYCDFETRNDGDFEQKGREREREREHCGRYLENA